MGKLIKKGERGAAANYITRTRAIRKLQLSLADFRRLCILKGIYPREPLHKKRAAGNGNANQTFYFAKDIQYLLHEPVVQKMRERKAFLKKLSRAIAKREASLVKNLENNEPIFTLDHLIKERYPTFTDALRDLDDCLSHLFLFATLPVTDRVKKEFVEESQRLVAEFQNYVIATRSMRKVFLSIKGIYYQAEIKGQTVTWLAPYQFSQEMPADVDFKVMTTFLEFYRTMMSFINYKLYTDLNIKYPPTLDAKLDEQGAGLIASYLIEPASTLAATTQGEHTSRKEAKAARREFLQRAKTLPEKLRAVDEHVEEDAMVVDENIDEDVQEEAAEFTITQELSQLQSLFANMTVFLSREVPRYSLEFVLRAFGAKVCWPETSGCGSPLPESSTSVTHQVVDRPPESLQLVADRIYIQPQWVYDCINAGKLLKHELYAPGKELPSHLSPFVVYTEGDYVPDGLDGMEPTTETTGIEEDGHAADAQDDDVEHQRELEAELSGIPAAKFEAAAAADPKEKSKKRPLAKEKSEKQVELEKLSRAKMVMSNKQRKIVGKMERNQARKETQVNKLVKKKRALQQGDATQPTKKPRK